MVGGTALAGFLLASALTGTSWAQTPEIDALKKAYPECSLNCMLELIPESSCMSSGGLNQTCVCTNAELNHDIAACAQTVCSVKELLTTQHASAVACNAPVRDHSTDKMIISFTLGGAALLTFIIRIITRLTTTTQRLYWDDWIALLAVLTTGPPTVFAYFLAANGIGRDIYTLQFQQITNVLQLFFYGELFYFVSLSIIKVSILLFFYRMFPVYRLRQVIIFVIAITTAYGIAFFFATLFQCRPIKYMWEQWHGEMEGVCNNFHLQGWIAAGIDIVLDIVILALPLRQLYVLDLSLRKRLSIMSMFLVGGIALVIAVVRLRSLIRFRHTENPTYDFYEAGVWSLSEVQVGILCANMPAIYQLIKVWKPKLVSGTTRGTRSNTGTAPTPDLKGSIVHGRFASTGAPRIKTMTHERSDSTEYLQWASKGREFDTNTVELAPTVSSATSPARTYVPPGQAF